MVKYSKKIKKILDITKNDDIIDLYYKNIFFRWSFMQKDNKSVSCPASQSEDEFIKKVKSGDRSSFSYLAELYSDKIEAIAYGFSTSSAEHDDLVQEGRIALYKAACAYDFRSSSFSTFATVCIRNRMLNWLENVNKDSVSLPLSSVEETALVKKAVSENSFEDTVILKSTLAEVISFSEKSLSDFEKRVFSLYIMGYTIKEISAELSISKKTCDNALFRIRSKLKAVRD